MPRTVTDSPNTMRKSACHKTLSEAASQLAVTAGARTSAGRCRKRHPLRRGESSQARRLNPP